MTNIFFNAAELKRFPSHLLVQSYSGRAGLKIERRCVRFGRHTKDRRVSLVHDLNFLTEVDVKHLKRVICQILMARKPAA